MAVTSKAQAGLYGAAAGGKATKAKGLSEKEAKKALKGKKLKSLPQYAKKK